MAGIDEFLDKVTVLPPGEWDPQIRLEPPSKVPSQANRKNTVDATKPSMDLASEPFKCKHCKSTLDHPTPVQWTKRCVMLPTWIGLWAHVGTCGVASTI